ncbi:MAG: YigZ family protein [candidate division KSB1 bacterium]|nr:YigZ family protein [candidate division KSB1 bacterium]
MREEESYFTVAAPVTVEYRAKDSRFIARLQGVSSRDQAEAAVHDIAQTHPDATHHCYAYRLGAGDRCIFRADDAGEPAGTAGRPILQALETRKVSDAVLVVTRYFGGTKLGIGGLIRAYGAAAFAALDAARLVHVIPKIELDMIFDYQETGMVHHVLNQFRAKVLSQDFSEQTRMRISIQATRAEQLMSALKNATRGKIQFT